jgi:hypothetical protein
VPSVPFGSGPRLTIAGMAAVGGNPAVPLTPQSDDDQRGGFPTGTSRCESGECARMSSSTLNSRLALNRDGLENFVIAVIRRAALELQDYALMTSPGDNIDDFLASVGRRGQPTVQNS